MRTDIINTAILAVSFLTLFGLGELLYRMFHVKAELTRKLAHFGTGFITLLFPIILKNHWWVLFLCASFALLLLVSLRYSFLPSINNINRKSYGSLCYPLAVYTTYLAYDYLGQQYFYFYIPILVLAICDPIAALTGKKWPIGKFSIGNETKSYMGTLCFFLTASLLVIVVLQLNRIPWHFTKQISMSLILASTTAIAEALTKKGMDNFTIPTVATITLYIVTQTF
jgi:phytol kinase